MLVEEGKEGQPSWQCEGNKGDAWKLLTDRGQPGLLAATHQRRGNSKGWEHQLAAETSFLQKGMRCRAVENATSTEGVVVDLAVRPVQM